MSEAQRIKCLHCGSVIQSQYTHDCQYCTCRSVYVTGGTSYFRHHGAKNAHYLIIKSDRDLDATLVGPRDISQD